MTSVLSLLVTSASAAAAAAPVEAEPSVVAPPRAGRRPGAPEARGANLALGRPCRPEPWCRELVDGSRNFTLRPGSRARQHSDRANGTGIEPGDGLAAREGEALTSGSFVARTFFVFLGEKVSVTQVIIFCSPVRGGNQGTGGPYRRRLVVMTWVGEAPAGGSDGTSLAGGRDLAAAGSQRSWERDVTVDPSSLGEGGGLRVVFQVDELATAVSVNWAAAEDAGCGDCAELRITEVELLARPAAAGAAVASQDEAVASREPLRLDDGREAAPSTRSGRSMVAMYPTPNTSGEAGRSLPVAVSSPTHVWRIKESEAAAPGGWSAKASLRDEGFRPAAAGPPVTTSVAAHSPDLGGARREPAAAVKLLGRGQGAPELAARKSATTNPPTTLMPDGAGAGVAAADVAGGVELQDTFAQAELVPQPGFLARPAAGALQPAGVGSVGNVPLLTWIALVAVTAMFLPRCYSCLSAKGLAEFAYDRLPEAEPEAARPAAEAGAGLRLEGPGPPAPVPGAAGPGAGSPGASRSPSPAPLQRARSSETEPEGEPGSDAGPPRGRPCQARGPGPAAARLRPPPVVLGCRQPASAAPAPAVRASSGRVVLLYASPLCYRDSANRPTPMPQIPFEREWSTMIQAYDEAAVALREAPCSTPARQGAGRPLQRRPGVALAAQPLTAGSLQRTVAPVATSSAASIVHLSAHGVRDCLVLEDGQGTAHFLSCEMLRRMLDLRNEAGGLTNAGPRLVILNACSLHAVGAQFVQGGVPHVICSSADLRDSASLVFLRNLYSNLFQGSSVARAFDAARVALRSDAEASTRAAADHFVLLPEGSPHTEVLFDPEWTAPASDSPASAAAARRRGALDGAPAGRPAAAAASGSSTEGPEESGGSEGPRSSDEGSASGVWRAGSSSSSDCEEGRRGGEAGAAEEARLLPAKGSAARAGVREAARRAARPPGGGAAELLAARRRVVWPEAAPPGRYAKPSFRRGACGVGNAPAAPAVFHSPFGRGVPPVPEDFLGRALDAWSVLQHLSSRRAVVVCGAGAEAHGVGKSAVLDAVHRAFALQMGGVCVAVQLHSLSNPHASAIGVSGWIETVASAVRQAGRECRERWWPAGAGPRPAARTLAAPRPLGGGALRRRPLRGGASAPRANSSRNVSSGFHALSDPIAVEAALRELVAEMGALSDLCEARCREWPAASSSILLLLDECDHLIQQKHFQDAVADLLQHSSACRLVLSTHQRMVGTAGGHFKVVHHSVEGLSPPDAARLFLRRAQRPLRWCELLGAQPGGSLASNAAAGAMAAVGAQDLRGPVVINRENETTVLRLVAAHPSVAAQRGNPRRLIELASRLGPTTMDLADLVPAEDPGSRKFEVSSGQDVPGDPNLDGELAPLLGHPAMAVAGDRAA